MTLHNTVEFARKALLGIALGFVAIIILFFLFRLGAFIKDALFPAKAIPANVSFDKIPKLEFPESIANPPAEYRINTVSGALPKFTDRINVYQLIMPQPNLLNLDKAKRKALTLNFKGENNQVIPEVAINSNTYDWIETTGLRRKIRFDTVTFDFVLTSSYLSSLTVLNAEELSDEERALTTTFSFLGSIQQAPKDVDKEKTNFELLAITNGVLGPASSLSKAHVIRVDLHQNSLTYDLNTGIPLSSGGHKKLKVNLPILYPKPPYSTMSFWIASGQTMQQVVAANYTYKKPDIRVDIEPTYPIKTAQEAFEELKTGKAYVATYFGKQDEVAINKIYLAYYIGEAKQEYLMPIYVFEGDDGFFAYVSAVRGEWIK